MKQFTFSIFLILLSFAASIANAQVNREVVYSDDFESYTAGAHIAQSIPNNWTTWNNSPGGTEDGVFSTEFASTGVMSAMISGTNDNVLKLGNKTSGMYHISWEMLIPTGFAGYYNFQHFEAPGNEWAFEVYFDNNGTGYMHAGGSNAATFTYAYNQWFTVENFIDLDADWAQVYFDGALIYEWQFSLQAQGEPGTNQLGGINFYAGSTAGMTPKYFLDDIEYTAITEQFIYADDFDAYTTGAYVAQTVPEFFTTWQNLPGTAEDATFSTDFAESAPNSVKIVGTTDLVMKLGNKTSGKYLVAFDYYVPATKAGYFNFQHMEAPGNEWAYEVYFDNNGTGYMHAGGANAATFTYTQGAWFHVDNVIDLDNDWAQVYFNDALIYEWQYSLQAQGEPGTNQLGGVNFYAGATSGMTPTYYFDNVAYAALVEGAQDPAIGVSTSPIITTIQEGNTYSHSLPITNTGEGTLEFEIAKSFDMPTAANQPSGLVPSGTIGKVDGILDYNPEPLNVAMANVNRDVVTIHYDEENAGGVGMTNGAQWRAAVRFPASMIAQYNGMYLTSVEVFIYESANAHKLQVYDMGSVNVPGPGALLVEQVFDPLPGWNTITLSTPLYVSGKELWVGCWFDQPAGLYPMGVDGAVEQHPDGHYISFGPGWTVSSSDGNWNIRAVLTGTAGPVWLSATPTTGELTAGQIADVTVGINASGLTPMTVYKGKLHIRSNDFANELVNVSVWITVLVGVNENGEQAYVSMYPNPANSMMNLKANTEIKMVSITNNLGQVVYSGIVGQQEFKMDISQFKTGMYIVRVETANGTATQKLMVD